MTSFLSGLGCGQEGVYLASDVFGEGLHGRVVGFEVMLGQCFDVNAKVFGDLSDAERLRSGFALLVYQTGCTVQLAGLDRKHRVHTDEVHVLLDVGVESGTAAEDSGLGPEILVGDIEGLAAEDGGLAKAQTWL
jgi:hypothetical protein